MIIGLGSDLCNIERIAHSLERFGERFEKRVFTDIERAKAGKRPFTRAGTYAKRFAAKEAFSKAVGLGMRSPMSWRAMQTLNDPSGKPIIKCSGQLQTFMEERYYTAQVSITDEVDLAMAFVVVIYGTPVVTGVTDPKDLMGS